MMTLDAAARRLAEGSHCRTFLEVWRTWRGDKVMPERDDVRPEVLRADLAAISVLDVEADDRIMVRVFSSEVTERTGISRKGANLIGLARAEDREERIRRLRNMVTTPCGALSDIVIVEKTGRMSLLRSLALPVGPAGGAAARLIYAASDLLDLPDDGVEKQAGEIPLAHLFCYVDIGAGGPDEGHPAP